MNQRRITFAIALMLVTSLLCACAVPGFGGAPTAESLNTLSTEYDLTESEPAESTTAPTEETLSAEERDEMLRQMAFERRYRPVAETYSYPFTETELAEILTVAEEYVRGFQFQNDVDIHRVTYEPYATDCDIRAWHASTDVSMPFKERYGLRVVVYVEYSFMPTEDNPFDVEYVSHRVQMVILSRSSHDVSWEKVDGMAIANRPTYDRLQEQYALTPEELSQFTFPTGRILGGYLLEDGGYLFYVWDEALEISRVVKIELPEPVEPEPYDIGLDWDKAFSDN